MKFVTHQYIVTNRRFSKSRFRNLNDFYEISVHTLIHFKSTEPVFSHYVLCRYSVYMYYFISGEF